MASLESFGRLLTETVAGDKLSASKVERVKESAAGQFRRGAKACQVIVKVHRKASERTKLSPLYLFDAVCRHAADIVRKRGTGFDYGEAEAPSGSHTERGTKQALIESASGFLHSASEIVEEMIMVTMEAVREDQKAKVFKVVDIWIKAKTFKEDQLMRVKGKLNVASSSKDPESSRHNEADQRAASTEFEQGAPTSIPSPYGMLMEDEKTVESSTKINTPPQIPSSLLALLGGSKAAVAAETKSKGVEEQKPSLDESQIAMLQQIALQNGEARSAPAPPQHHLQHPQRQERVQPSLPPPPPPPPADVSHPPLRSHTSAAPPPPVQSVSSFVPDQSVGDLSRFNFMEFDPTNAASWLTFAQQWHNTYQYVPSNQELMFAMMSAMQAQMYASNYDGSW